MFGSQVAPVIPTRAELEVIAKEREVRKAHGLEMWRRSSQNREHKMDNTLGHLRQARLGNCGIEFKRFDDDIEEHIIGTGRCPRDLFILALERKVDYRWAVTRSIYDHTIPNKPYTFKEEN